PNNTNGRVTKGALEYAVLPDVERRGGSVTFIDFGGSWPAPVPFRLAIAEGKQKPAWDDAHRVLTVYLPKSAMITVACSSYMPPRDLRLMGVWDWLRQILELEESES